MSKRLFPDIEIAQSATPVPIAEIAGAVGILAQELELYGNTKAKVKLAIMDCVRRRPNGKDIVVAAITPTRSAKAKPPPPSVSARPCSTGRALGLS